MDKLHELLRPDWGSEKWIAEGWERISDAERDVITARVDALFQYGLPFELKHDKILYIHAFSLLAQLEVLAVQVPLKFESRLSNPAFKQQLHTQLLDEIFHGIVFTKIAYALSAPYALPPTYSESLEMVCDFIRNQDCPKVALILLNLIGEGWIEELFRSLAKQGIAPRVFETILADENRHVSEADLYHEIGLPDKAVIRDKLIYVEEQLINQVFLQSKNVSFLLALIGGEGMTDFLQSMDKKYRHQLKKISLYPGEHWQLFMKLGGHLFPSVVRYEHEIQPVPMTSFRKILKAQWNNPSDPTMVGEFDLNVTNFEFFEKHYSPETLTILMLQSISLIQTLNPAFRYFFSHHNLYVTNEAHTGIVIKLPNCGDHIGTIVLENCHEMTVSVLMKKIRHISRLMSQCYKKREELERKHPHLVISQEQIDKNIADGVYPCPVPGHPFISMTNLGINGYTRAKSPLLPHESMKFTLLEVNRRQVWNKNSRQFEAQDILPISISADHRVIDGNVPIPKLMGQCYEKVFENMIKTGPVSKETELIDIKQFILMLDRLTDTSPEFGYKAMCFFQTIWFDSFAFEDFLHAERFKIMLAKKFSMAT